MDMKQIWENCKDTGKLYAEICPWNPMSTTAHKILIHATMIIKHPLLPTEAVREGAAVAE